ncbi:MAG: hypothetical protein IPK19_28855 [Chloroflexi bacterium]|nr:hypothetical protein [Chloroflexota bacterium]
MVPELLLVFILACPLVGPALNLTLTSRLKAPTAGIIASAAAGLAFLGSLLQIVLLAQGPEEGFLHVHLLNWIAVGTLQVGWDLRADTLTAAMMAMVTGVGLLIHLYSIGYMRHDERFTRFFVYLNLFLAAMLLLVAADNYLVLFVGWEGVGVCSYLLIGFWFDKPDGQGCATAPRRARRSSSTASATPGC